MDSHVSAAFPEHLPQMAQLSDRQRSFLSIARRSFLRPMFCNRLMRSRSL